MNARDGRGKATSMPWDEVECKIIVTVNLIITDYITTLFAHNPKSWVLSVHKFARGWET